MPSRTIRDDKMTVSEEAGLSASASTGTNSTTSGASSSDSKPSKKSKVKSKKKPNSDNDSSNASKPTKPPRDPIDALTAAPETPKTSPSKKSKKVAVVRTKSGSDLPPKSPVKRVKSPSASGGNNVKNLGESKPPARKISPEVGTPENKKAATADVPQSRAARRASTNSTTSSNSGKLAQEKMATRASLDSSTKMAGRASTPASPAKSRASIQKQMDVQEADLSAKKRVSGDSAKESSKRNATPSEPGAYSVQGPNEERVHSGVLSPQSTSSPPVGQSGRTRPAVATSPASNSQVPRKAPSPARKRLVVAAELSTDLEAHIEDEIRRRIMSEAAKAQVVSVAHGIPMLDPKEEARRLADLRELHKPRGVREKIFGDSRNSDVDIATSPASIRKRNYLKWAVARNQATGLWVATVQTKQKAVEQRDVIEVERTSVSFSATTQEEAFETGLANAVPMMQPTEEHPICFVCKAKFALFRRPQHCKNCGVCICSSCTTQWPGKMFPETCSAKTQNNVCTACNWLANSFRDALVEGNLKTALHLYSTGNLNIRTPFCLDKKAEIMYVILKLPINVAGAAAHTMRRLTNHSRTGIQSTWQFLVGI
jgi:hypothetical protein